MKSPYQILGISRDASPKEIDRVFRELALKYHPDKHENDPKKTKLFSEIKAAYEFITERSEREISEDGVSNEIKLDEWAEYFNDAVTRWAEIARGENGKFRTSGDWTVEELENKLTGFFERYGLNAKIVMCSRRERFQWDGIMYWMSRGLLKPAGSYTEEQSGEIYYKLTSEGVKYIQRKKIDF